MTLLHKFVWLCVLSFVGIDAHADTLVLCDSMTSELKGESIAAGATGCIEVASWSWGVSAPVGLGGSSPGKPMFSDFSLQKFVDSSSTTLMTFLVKDASFKGTLQFRIYGNCVSACTTPTPYFTVDMTKAFVTSQSIGGSSDGRPVESISLTYDSIKVCYRVADQSGMLGNPTCEMYTISTGASSN